HPAPTVHPPLTDANGGTASRRLLFFPHHSSPTDEGVRPPVTGRWTSPSTLHPLTIRHEWTRTSTLLSGGFRTELAGARDIRILAGGAPASTSPADYRIRTATGDTIAVMRVDPLPSGDLRLVPARDL